MDRLFSTQNKIAVITGGMGQLGQIYTHALIERGSKVAIIDQTVAPRSDSKIYEKAVKSGQIKAYQVDITDKEAVKEVATSIKKDLGTPTILINNAAIDSPPSAPPEEVGPFETYPIESFSQIMDVNVNGTFICCQVFGNLMAQNDGGSIVNISSIYGILSPRQDIYEFRRKKGEVFYKPVAYSVSKSAIMNLTRYLATYWGKKKVRINTLVLSGIFNNQSKEFIAAYTQHMPIGRMTDPKEVIGPMVFLVSDASSYMTGSSLVIDGGWSAW